MRKGRRVLKPSKIIFENEELKGAYEGLPATDILKKRIDRVIENIKENAFYGEPISKKLIPTIYKKKGFTNAFWVSLGKEWRLIYSVTSLNKIEILAIILEWFTNHKDYEKRFGY